ncbi:MAG: threonine synthase [Neisseriaceae bacterium]|nr:threonine synthase [Neisseriaceae bacterium]
MKYISTRGASPLKSFSEVLLAGLAEDGGLYMPQEYPHIPATTLDKWRDLSYPELAFEIMRLFMDDIHEPVIRFLAEKTYCAENFGTDEVKPVRMLKDGVHILGLSNGPTLAFKDIAMQFLGNAFEYVLTHQKKTLNIIGATSGDTGSAAEYAMRGKRGIKVFMLSPAGKMSAFQRAQMYSLQDTNIFNIAVDGMFDDCQDIVKAIQNDAAFKEEYKVGTVNSINWARVMAQVVYYFKAYFAITFDNDEKVSFCVPSGNFGDICAGHVAKQMGLPIDRLIVATNENDVLDEFFQTGIYRPRAARDVVVTSSPSMDIAKASNLERFVFDLVRRDPEQVKALWAEIEAGKPFDLKRKLKAMKTFYGFDSGKCTHAQRIETIRQVWAEDEQVIDPHTATAVYLARQVRQPNEKMVCLETALPAKFDDTIKEALGQDFAVPRPEHYIGIEDKLQKVFNMPNNAVAVKMFMKENISL